MDGDYGALNVPIMFSSGLSDGAMICANVSLLSDDLVECVEDFTIVLTLDTTKDTLSVLNNSTVVTLLDSDGKNCEASLSSLKVFKISPLFNF